MTTDRILTTHVGSLPRPKDVTDLVFAQEAQVPIDDAGFDAVVAAAVDAVIARQKSVGIDIPSDGEMSKISYATYIKYRLSGFSGDHPRNPPADLELYPTFLERLAKSGGTATYTRPICTGAVAMQDITPLDDDIRRMRAAMDNAGYADGFMNAASPGVIALFQPNEFYATQDDYLEAVAEAMRAEYEAITEAGLTVQLDSPDVGLGRHTMYKDLDEPDFVRRIGRHVEVLNHALRNIPADAVRMHICWGNYEGPHTCDVGLDRVLPTVLTAKPRALLFETSNPRHAHEWPIWETVDLDDDYTLIPGVIDTTTNFVEHPELVAERITRYANLVGRDRVIAGTDCGFGTFAGFGAVDGEIAWAKLQALSDGAAIASKRLWN